MNRHYNVHTYIHIFTYAHEYSIFTYICEYICAVDVYESSVLYIQWYKVSVWQITSRTYELTYVRMPVELLCTYVRMYRNSSSTQQQQQCRHKVTNIRIICNSNTVQLVWYICMYVCALKGIPNLDHLSEVRTYY